MGRIACLLVQELSAYRHCGPGESEAYLPYGSLPNMLENTDETWEFFRGSRPLEEANMS
jgi:hypothetical protein